MPHQHPFRRADIPTIVLAGGWSDDAEFRAAKLAASLAGWRVTDDVDGTVLLVALNTGDPAAPIGFHFEVSGTPSVVGTADEVTMQLARWLLDHDPRRDSQGPTNVLAVAIEHAIEGLQGLIDDLRSQLRLRDARIVDLEAHIEQLESIERALRVELAKRDGPEPESARPLARAAAAILLAIISGAAGGLAQAKATPAPTVEIIEQAEDVRERCQVVIVVANEHPAP